MAFAPPVARQAVATMNKPIQGEPVPVFDVQHHLISADWPLDPQQVFGYALSTGLVFNIFSYLSPNEWIAAAQVSRTWYKFLSADSLWKPEMLKRVRGVIPNYSWKALFVRAGFEHTVSRPVRLRNAQAIVSAWQCHVACGMRAPPPFISINDPPAVDLGEFPQLEWQAHPNSSKELVMNPSIDLLQAVDDLFQFQNLMKATKPEHIGLYLARYDAFMRLQAKYPDAILIPSSDIEYIWQSHLLRPSQYEQDMDEVYGLGLVPHSLRISNIDLIVYNEAVSNTYTLWKKEYGHDYLCAIPNQDTVRKIPPYAVEGLMSCFVESDGDRRNCITHDTANIINHFPDFSNPLRMSEEDLRKDTAWFALFEASLGRIWDIKNISGSLVKLYERYLYLGMKMLQVDSAARFHPTYPIDIVWHAHMLHPHEYRTDCDRYVGKMLDHEPWPEEKGECGMNALWEAEYGVKLNDEGRLQSYY